VAGPTPRRALILAGGGMKVAFQAGVLQVWLDEAGLTFDHADGASGGVFNLAMLCQGMSGAQIADNWRQLDPIAITQPNWPAYPKLLFAESLFRLDRLRRVGFSRWGLDWDAIRATDLEATFNAYDFTEHRLVVREAADVTEDFVVAGVSLPMWFPPVTIDGHTFIDAVYITDANLEEAIRRGADELWIIWTVSEAAEWRNGFVANYFQVIETAANGHFRRMLERIDASNEAIAGGANGEFGRHIDVKLLRAEVPLHYLINFSQDRSAQAVELGVRAGRAWCRERAIGLGPPASTPPEPRTSLRFTEEMAGHVGFGIEQPVEGRDAGRRLGTSLGFRLTIRVPGVERFLLDPDLEAGAEGVLRCDELGGHLPVERGVFNLFVDRGDPSDRRMLYRLFFRDADDRPLTFTGYKVVRDDPGRDLWRDTTTLYVRILAGHVERGEDAVADVVASGILRLGALDFLRQLTTFRVEGPTFHDRADAIGRFGLLFAGRLWDVYARDVLTSSPV
jgi:predicted acylesterase/phospholipase RssA